MTPSRRDLLTAFLGAPAVLAAGCARTAIPTPPGELVGAADGVGHRLRDRPPPRPEQWENVGTVIVGGGAAGLAAARRLLQAGVRDFVLLELERAPGGTARSGDSPAGPHPWGAHYVPAPLPENKCLLELLAEMGVVEGTRPDGSPVYAEECLARDPAERVYFRGEWHDGLYLHEGASADDEAQLRRFLAEAHRWAGWRDGRGRRAFALPVSSSSDDATVTELDRTTTADWLDKNRFTSPRLRWLVDYACRDDYGCTIEQTSAWAGLFYWASRLARPGAEPQPLLTWPEGNGRLIAHLYQRAHAQVRLGWAAADINPTDAGVEVTAVDFADTAVRGFRARRVILAAPRYLTRYLVRPWREKPPAFLGAFEYGAWLVVNLHLRDRPANRGFAPAWDNVLYESNALGYVVNAHQQGRDHGPCVFTWYYALTDDSPRAARTRLLSLSREDCAELALADLTPAHPDLRSLTERADALRWGHAMVRPVPGLVWGTARRQAAQPYRGVHFAGADLSGVALFEEALDHGVRAAEEVLRAI